MDKCSLINSYSSGEPIDFYNFYVNSVLNYGLLFGKHKFIKLANVNLVSLNSVK
jgi:hypothetical protein